MPVNPDDLLIFKLREKAKLKNEAAQAPPKSVAPAATVPVAHPAEEIRKQASVKVGPAPAAKEPAVQREAPNAEESLANEARLEMKYGYAPEGVGSAPKKSRVVAAKELSIDLASSVTGALFIISAIVFGYIIYHQSLFIISYISKVGLVAFLAAINYEYEISLMNITLVLLSAISGMMMLATPGKAHRFGGIVGALVIMAVTFEYLNSNSEYLFVVILLAFFEIGILAYLSMSTSSRAAEIEDIKQEDIVWPRIETF